MRTQKNLPEIPAQFGASPIATHPAMKDISGGADVIIVDSSVHSPFLAEASLVAIAVSGGASHILHYVNPAFCRLFGKSHPEFLGRPFPDVVPEGASVTAGLLLDRVFRSGEAESLTDDTLVPQQPDGEVPSWSYTVWPLLDRWGRPIGLVTQVSHTANRVPASNEAYAVMLTANQQLVLAALHESERSEALLLADRAKDEFLAMLAHELRNPLAAIRTGVYLVSQRAGSAAPELQPDCALIERQIGHLARLLDDLLDVSRITSGKIELRMEQMDLLRVVEQAIVTTAPLMASRRHEFTATWPPEAVCVDGDPARMEQILTNLLQNAGKYTDPGGRIWITIETDHEIHTNPSSLSGAGEAVIRVRDTGIGIAPEALPHIFDLFVQTDRSLDRSQGGLGIGLTLVRRLVQMHGGSVVAHSAGRGQGSEFVVRLPMQEATQDVSVITVAPSAPEMSAPAAGARVLVVDDNVEGAEVLGSVLELWGYEVEIVYSGKDAIRVAAAAPPEIILLDIGLPEMNGYEVARTLRTQPSLNETLLVAVTGYGQETDRGHSLDAGFDHHLTKPVNLDQLRATISARSGRAAP